MNKILKAPFIDRVDEWPRVRVVRLKGPIDKEVIPQMDRLKDVILRDGGFEHKNIIFDVAKVTAFDSAFGRVPLGSASATEAVPVAEDPPYRRLTLTLPEGDLAGYAEIVVSGGVCTDPCLSVLLRSVTFR